MNKTLVRILLWVYFWLLILEGPLRKWILPGFSDYLLIVRDPIAISALIFGWTFFLKRRNVVWLSILLIISVLGFILAISVGHGDVLTAAFGARILLLHLPLIFLFGEVFDRNDTIKFCWAFALLTLPMTLLLVAQSYLPTSHILNVAPGGEGTAVFQGALDRFRPPAVFSFVSGVPLFYSSAASSIAVLLLGTSLQTSRRLYCILAVSCLIVAVPVSVSRSLVGSYMIVFFVTFISLVLSRSRLSRLILAVLIAFLSLFIAIRIPAFEATSDAFVARWRVANAIDGAVADNDQGVFGVFRNRILSPLIVPFVDSDRFSFLGSGIGIGTNFGSQRLVGKRAFLVDEDSWAATLGELGFPLGFLFILWRFFLGLNLLRLSLTSALIGNKSGLILLGSCFLPLVVGQISQPTTLGFIVVSSGLTFASCIGKRTAKDAVTPLRHYPYS